MTIVRIAAGPVFIQRSRNVQRMHICNDWYFSGRQRGKFHAACRRVFTKSRQLKIIALPHSCARRSFVAHDQLLATAIPGAHDLPCTFCLADAQSASKPACFLLDFSPHQQGRRCRGPYLETECARRVRRVRFRRRDLTGGILSSRGRRRRQTNN